LIDTGFTGFAAMPARDAAEAGLSAIGTMDLTYADGTIHPAPVAWASVALGADVVEGFVFVLEGGDFAVGVHFLRLFKKTLIYSVAERSVVLADAPG
jgi:predicted aspartyl protease